MYVVFIYGLSPSRVRNGWRVFDMDFIIMFFLVGAIIAAGIAIWLNTKSGKNGLQVCNLCIRHLFTQVLF